MKFNIYENTEFSSLNLFNYIPEIDLQYTRFNYSDRDETQIEDIQNKKIDYSLFKIRENQKKYILKNLKNRRH